MSGMPSGWVKVAIGETGEYVNGFAFKPEHREPTGRPIVRIQNLTDPMKPLNRTQLKVPDAYEVRAGGMLVSWSATLDVFVWRGETALVNQHIFKVVPEVGLFEPRLLFYWLKRAIDELEETEHLHGSTMKHINRGPFMAHELPLPPYPEQARIVAKLEELLPDLDAGVAELKAAQRKLAQYRQSLLKAAVEGALTAEWRAANPPQETGGQLLQRILTERRQRWEARQLERLQAQGKALPKDWQKKYPEPVQPGIAELPALPKGWVWASVDQLASLGTGVTPLRSKRHYFEGGDIPWVTSGALNDEWVARGTEMVTSTAMKECRLELYPPGSLLIAMYGEGKTRGKCAELSIPATINQAIAALVFEGIVQECRPYIKTFLLKSYDDMRGQASGGVQPNLNLQIIRSVAVPLPPLAEQMAVRDHLSEQLEAASIQQIEIERILKHTAAQRQNLLRAAFAGQLVPQDPNDEPASVLLDRIRAERAAQGSVKKPRGRAARETA